MSMNIDYLQNPKHVYAPVHGGMESTAAVLDAVELMVERTRLLLNEAAAKDYI